MKPIFVSVFFLGFIACGGETLKIDTQSLNDKDSKKEALVDCNQKSFTREKSFGSLIPADSLFVFDSATAKLSLCDIIRTQNKTFLTLQFVSANSQQEIADAKSVSDLITKHHSDGYHMLVFASQEKANAWPKNTVNSATFYEPENKLAGYFTKNLAVVNYRKEADAAEIGTLPEIIEAAVSVGEGDDKDRGRKPEDENFDPLTKGLSLLGIDNLKTELEYITKDEYAGRLSATSGNEQVADYLIEHLTKLGIQPANASGYRQNFTMDNGPTSGKTTSNIVGLIPGNDPALKDQYVVIGAHMDHAGTMQLGYTCSKSGSDPICNGADDNGSGTISVLNVAKALAAVRSKLKRSVIVMWFSGEEEGLEGSYHFVNSNPLVPLTKIVYMINLDMVGYAKSYGNKVSALGGASSSVGKSILMGIDNNYPNFKIDITEKAGGGSDHVPFMAEGIPGAFFHTGVSNNPNYHRTSDSPDKIDYEGMLTVAKITFETILKVVNEPTLVAFNFNSADLERESLVSEQEKQQACHVLGHLH